MQRILIKMTFKIKNQSLILLLFLLWSNLGFSGSVCSTNMLFTDSATMNCHESTQSQSCHCAQTATFEQEITMVQTILIRPLQSFPTIKSFQKTSLDLLFRPPIT